MFALPSDAQAIFEAAKAKVSFRTLTVLIVKCLLNEDEEWNNYYYFLEFRQQITLDFILRYTVDNSLITEHFRSQILGKDDLQEKCIYC